MTKKKLDQIRQGDVLLVPVKSAPKLKARKDRTLALGEATGHHHTLTEGTVLGTMGGDQFVVVDTEAELQHLPHPGVEHDTLVVAPGTYEVAIQVEETAQVASRRLQE